MDYTNTDNSSENSQDRAGGPGQSRGLGELDTVGQLGRSGCSASSDQPCGSGDCGSIGQPRRCGAPGSSGQSLGSDGLENYGSSQHQASGDAGVDVVASANAANAANDAGKDAGSSAGSSANGSAGDGNIDAGFDGDAQVAADFAAAGFTASGSSDASVSASDSDASAVVSSGATATGVLSQRSKVAERFQVPLRGAYDRPASRPLPPKLYRIGEVVDYSGLSRQTIHNYTTMGLIRESRWTPGGHRLYDESTFERLNKIASFKADRKSLEFMRDYFAGIDH